MDMMSETSFDVIVSDYQMPETNGIDFLKMVRAKGSDIPFILFTGKGRESVVIEALNQGADFYLQKGGDLRSQFHELASMISQAVQSRRASVDLVESQERFRGLANSISDLLIGLDDDFRVTFWNRAAEEVLKINSEEAVGLTAFDLVPQIKGTPVEEALRTAANSQNMTSELTDLLSADGARTFEVNVYPGVEGLLVFARDVTETKAAAQLLAESEERYRALVEAAPNAIVVYATDTILYANPAAVRVYGGDDESDLLGKRVFDLMPPEFATETAARIRKMHEESVPVPPRSVKVYTKTGQLLDMEINSIPITFSGRKAIQTILRDVTKEKRAEALLRAHQEELRTIIDSVPSMISYQDVEGKFLRVNRLFAETTGLDEEQLRGRKVEDVLPGFGEMFSPRDKEVIETGRPLIGALTPYPASQGVRWARTDKMPYKNDAGEVAGILTVAEDITDRRRAEEDAARIREQLEHLVSESSAVTYSCNAEPPFDATYTSPNVKRLYGYEPEECAQNPGFWASMIHPDDSERVFRELQELFEIGYHIHEYRWKRKDGTYAWIHDEVRLIRDEAGVPTQMVGLWLDITERKKAEDGLRMVNKKLNLLGSITRHDSMNQLTALRGWLTAAVEKEGDDSVRDMLLKVEKAADSLKTHLDFTAQYKNLGMKRPGWMPLAEVVAKVTEGLGRQGISVSVEVEDIEIFADPMLENVFRNFLNDSIAHGGHVDNISFSYEEGEDGLLIVYEDNGVGIPAEEKTKIFARGYGKRHGYGLYLSREILSITDMVLRETGIPDEGARFEISVPPGYYRRRSG